ncbi:sigma-70 region 4 domain-containing protein [Actinoallomurus sp. NBC_01490]
MRARVNAGDPDAFRELFRRARSLGLQPDYAEAAEALGVPVGAVRSRLSRARKRLNKLVTAGRLRPPEGDREPHAGVLTSLRAVRSPVHPRRDQGRPVHRDAARRKHHRGWEVRGDDLRQLDSALKGRVWRWRPAGCWVGFSVQPPLWGGRDA